MGNHYGTVRCGACYQRGHNRRSCPEALKRLQKRFDRFNASDCDYDKRMAKMMADKIAVRTGVNPLTGDKLEKRGPTRRCSYCKYKYGDEAEEGLGHTRRTCSALKADIQRAIEKTAAMRSVVLEGMRAAGIGVGSLVSQRYSDYFPDPENPGEKRWDRREVVCMVTDVMWDKMSIYNSRAPVLVLHRMDKLDTQRRESMELPYLRNEDQDILRVDVHGDVTPRMGSTLGAWKLDDSENDYQRRALVSPVSADKINPPANWLSGESDTIVAAFKAKKA